MEPPGINKTPTQGIKNKSERAGGYYSITGEEYPVLSFSPSLQILTSTLPSTHLTDFAQDPAFAGAPLRLRAITLHPAATSCEKTEDKKSQRRRKKSDTSAGNLKAGEGTQESQPRGLKTLRQKETSGVEIEMLSRGRGGVRSQYKAGEFFL